MRAPNIQGLSFFSLTHSHALFLTSPLPLPLLRGLLAFISGAPAGSAPVLTQPCGLHPGRKEKEEAGEAGRAAAPLVINLREVFSLWAHQTNPEWGLSEFEGGRGPPCVRWGGGLRLEPIRPSN